MDISDLYSVEVDLNRVGRLPTTMVQGGKLATYELVSMFLGKLGVAVNESVLHLLLTDVRHMVKEGKDMRVFPPLGPKLLPITRTLSHVHKQRLELC